MSNSAKKTQEEKKLWHSENALSEALQARDENRQHPMFESPSEWATGLMTELGTVALYAEQLTIDTRSEEANKRLRERVAYIAGYCLAWADHIESPLQRERGGLLVRSVRKDYLPPQRIVDEEKKAKK